MGNILFQGKQKPTTLLDQLNQIKSQGPSSALYDRMYSTNPQFRAFADSMKGKTPEQAFSEHGLDFNRFRGLRW